MKKYLLWGLFFLLSAQLFSQTDNKDLSNAVLQCRYGNLYNSTTMEKMDVPTLGGMLSKESFYTYCQARAEYMASLSMWAISGTGAASSLIIALVGHKGIPNYSPMSYTFYYTPFICTFALTVAALVPAVVLTADSYRKLNRVAADYNNTPGRTLSLGLSGHGVGLTFKF